MQKNLTKTNFMQGLQCPRLLWISVNKPELYPLDTKASQFNKELGTEIGVLATKTFPDGLNAQDYSIQKTKEAITKRIPILNLLYFII